MAVQGLFFIIQEWHGGSRHAIDDERRRMYARPDCPPSPASPEPDPAARRHALSFHGLRQRLSGPTRP